MLDGKCFRKILKHDQKILLERAGVGKDVEKLSEGNYAYYWGLETAILSSLTLERKEGRKCISKNRLSLFR